MKKFLTLALTCTGLALFSQVGQIKTEEYKAKFEQNQSIDDVSDYNDTIQIPIQILKIGINEELYSMYPELKSGMSAKMTVYTK